MLLIIKRKFFWSDETSCNLNKYLTWLIFCVTSFSQLYAAMCRVCRPHKKANKQYLFTKGTNSSVCLCGLVLTCRRYLWFFFFSLRFSLAFFLAHGAIALWNVIKWLFVRGKLFSSSVYLWNRLIPILQLHLIVSILLLPLLLNIYKALWGGCHLPWYKTLFYKACMLVVTWKEFKKYKKMKKEKIRSRIMIAED